MKIERWESTTLTYRQQTYLIVVKNHQVVFIGSPNGGKGELAQLMGPHPPLIPTPESLNDYKQRLYFYLHGMSSELDLPFKLIGTPFQKTVWRALLTIPAGETETYSEIAQRIDRPTATRAVARAIGQNRLLFLVPCHRVIGKDGTLTGFRAGLNLKRHLLTIELGKELSSW